MGNACSLTGRSLGKCSNIKLIKPMFTQHSPNQFGLGFLKSHHSGRLKPIYTGNLLSPTQVWFSSTAFQQLNDGWQQPFDKARPKWRSYSGCPYLLHLLYSIHHCIMWVLPPEWLKMLSTSFHFYCSHPRSSLHHILPGYYNSPNLVVSNTFPILQLERSGERPNLF